MQELIKQYNNLNETEKAIFRRLINSAQKRKEKEERQTKEDEEIREKLITTLGLRKN